MTASERIGTNLPELLEELGAPRVPDYFDDLLRTTAATGQRPAWSSLERWLPVASISRPAPFGLPSWQPLLLLILLLLGAVIGGALLIGGQPRVPAPFGPAQNGTLLASGVDGSLMAIDPQSASASAFGNTPDRYYPWHSPDGRRMLYTTKDANGLPVGLFVANADGSAARQLHGDAASLHWVEWTPTSDSVLLVTAPGPDQQAIVEDVATGQQRALDFGGLEVSDVFFRPDGQLVFAGHSQSAGTWAYYRTGLDTIQPHAITAEFPAEQWGAALSPDGATLAYASYGDAPAVVGQVHLVDVATGTDRAIDLPGYTGPEVADMNPAFSPDGQWLLVNRFDTTSPWGGAVLARVDVSGEAVRMADGPKLDADQAPEHVFSPDGAWLVLRYPEDQSVWVYDTATGQGRQVQGLTAEGLSWQRR